MRRFLGSYSEFLFGVLRVVAAFNFLLHGLQKFNIAALNGFVPPFAALEAAKWIETIGGPLILVGLGTRWVAFILSGEMAVAYFMSHASRSPWPLVNGGEITVLYCFFWLYLAARGAGAWSIDGLLGID